LLDGQKITMAELNQAMTKGAAEKAVVWYYRENAGGEPPPIAMEVLKLITTLRLPIRLSSKSDFSDAVNPGAGLERLGEKIREKASQRNLVVLRPDGQLTLLPAMQREAAPPQGVAAVEKMLPSDTKRNVAVIADTAWTMTPSPSIQVANEAIPFLGLLMGFAAIVHAVLVFKARALEIIGAVCRDADLLIVDDARLASLPRDWQARASGAMRGKQILVHDRTTFQLRPLR
jgi:hypothetical protein